MVGKCDKMITLPVAVEQETVWLNRNQMAELFGRDIKTIGKHINNALYPCNCRKICDSSKISNLTIVLLEKHLFLC